MLLFSYKCPNSLLPVILPAYATNEGRIECSRTSAYNIQMQGNHPKERIKHSEHGKSVKSLINSLGCFIVVYYIVVGSLIME
jgi:hypothetical protein